MDTTHHNPGSSATHEYVPSPAEIAVGHELRDTHLRPIFLFTAIFTISVAIVIFFIIGVKRVMNTMQNDEYAQTNKPHPVSEMNIGRVPPGPLIEPSVANNNLPHEDLKLTRDREARLLTARGPVDFDDQDVVRVPLKDVQDWVVDNGLPAKLPATQPSPALAVPPGSSMYGPGGVP